MRKIILRKSTILISACFLLLTAACYTGNPYIFKGSQNNKSSIRFVSSYKGFTEKANENSVYEVISTKCRKSVISTWTKGLKWISKIGTTDPAYAPKNKYLGLPLSNEYDKQDYSEVNIVAGQKFTFLMDSVRQTERGYQYTVYSARWCNVHLSFRPKANSKYEAILEYDDNSCSAKVYELIHQDGKYIKLLDSTQESVNFECIYE